MNLTTTQIFGRLLDFSMREIIFVGEDEFVKKMRSKSIELLKRFPFSMGN